MQDNFTKASHYRDQAAHLRNLAAQDENPDTREALLSVARKYGALAVKYFAVADPDQFAAKI